jgi:hypothetical protein
MNKKVACIGNKNHFMLNLVRFLRNNNVDAWLLLLEDENDNFHPKNDDYTNNYKSFTISLNWRNKPIYLFTKKEIQNDLNGFDILIGCDFSPAFINKAKLKLDAFVPFGEDIYGLPFKKSKPISITLNLKKNYSNLIWKIRENELYKNQKKGIIKAKNIFMDILNPEFEKEVFSKLKFSKKRKKIPPPFIYTPIYNKENITKLRPNFKINDQLDSLRKENDILIFNQSRQCWKNPPDKWSNKGNDILFKGFANFIHNNKLDIKIKLICCEYGPDVDESKCLIEKLNIVKYVHWLPVISRKEVFIVLSYCDLGIGQLKNSWFSYTSIYEFLAMEIPVVHYRNDNEFNLEKLKMYPMYNVNKVEELSALLNNYIDDPVSFKKTGKKGRVWYEKYGVNAPLKEFIEITK